MRGVPSCLSRRYRAIDELVEELDEMITSSESMTQGSDNNGALKLMCELWDILKEDQDGAITKESVQQRFESESERPIFKPHNIFCYSARKACCNKKSSGCKVQGVDSKESRKSTTSTSGPDSTPLTQVICNLKEAASFDKKCNEKIDKLADTQKDLQDKVTVLEDRDRKAAEMLKQADCMWSCMEDSYKQKVKETQQNQNELNKQLREIDKSSTKWRKNRKDLEQQMVDLNNCVKEIMEKTHQKKNDLKVIDGEIAGLEKKLQNLQKETDATKASLSKKKGAGDANVTKIYNEISRLEKLVSEEMKIKTIKEQAGCKMVRELRDELQKVCTEQLTKKIENEDLSNEINSLQKDIELLNQTFDTCKNKCNSKKLAIKEEIKKIDKEIAQFKNQCVRCHQCTDTIDVRKLCTDCPRCLKDRECKLEDDHCVNDPVMDCICMATKRKFMDNVFENMYTVLTRQSKSNPGKAVAEQILKSLKRSRNGKLCDETRQIVHDFILNAVKRNLNLTVIGGAVKTRCEMDADSYKQLMMCLKSVKAAAPPKADKATPTKKDSCRRWGGSVECNCPKGPKNCICNRKAMPTVSEPTPCPSLPEEDKDANLPSCPHKTPVSSCGAECGARTPSREWSAAPCASAPGSPPAPFTKNMRAAQCVLGNEPLNTRSKTKHVTLLDDATSCKCGKNKKYTCTCKSDCTRPRERVIEEVMGKYEDTSVDTVGSDDGEIYWSDLYDCTRIKVDKMVSVRNTCFCNCDSSLDDVTEKKDKTFNISFNKTENVQKYPLTSKTENETIISVSKSGSYNFDETQTMHKRVKVTNDKRQKSVEMGLQVILEPRFRADNRLCVSQKKKTQNTQETDKKKSKTSGRLETKICDVVTELMKDVIEKGKDDSYDQDLDLHWMSLESLFKKITPDSSLSAESSSEKVNVHINNKNVWRDTRESKIGIHTCLIRPLKNLKIANTNGRCKQKCQTKSPSRRIKVNNSNRTPKYYNGKRSGFFWQQLDNKTENSGTCFEDICSPDDVASNDSTCSTRPIDMSFIRNDIKRQYKVAFNESIHDMTRSYATETRTTQLNKGCKTNNILSKGSTKNKRIEDPECLNKELLKKYNNNKPVSIKVQGKNGLSTDMVVPLARTQSGNVAIDADNLSSLGNISSKVCPVALSLSSSGEYTVDITQPTDDSNAVLRKTPSGSFLIVVQNYKPIQSRKHDASCSPTEHFFNFNIRNGQCHLHDVPCVLKRTPSDNYTVVIDKEYEKHYKQTINDIIQDGIQCSIQLIRTGSGIYQIDVNDFADNIDNEALLVKSGSGTIKIIPHINSTESLDIRGRIDKKCNVILDLLDEISKSYIKNKNDSIKTSNNDSIVYGQVRVLTSDEEFVLEPPTTLKRTTSGQFIIVLDKMLKTNLVNNLKMCYDAYSSGAVPIKKTESGDIIIDLNKKSKGEPGSIKITPSGNVIIIIDSEFVDKMIDESCRSPSLSGTSCAIGKVERPVDKCVTTTCNAGKDYSCDCDFSKCICQEILEMTKKHIIKKDNTGHKNYAIYQSNRCGKSWWQEKRKTSPKRSALKRNISIDESIREDQFSDIKSAAKKDEKEEKDSICPLYVHDKSLENKKSSDNFFYFIKAVPYNRGNQRKPHEFVKTDPQCLDWDVIEYLPPQLPEFLGSMCNHSVLY